MALNNLLAGEIKLTLEIIFSMALSEILLRLNLPSYLLKHLRAININPTTALALTVSIGSSKTGAGILANALDKNLISEKIAVWSVLMLPLISYLKRWPGTFFIATGMAGISGSIFALSLLLRSAGRFCVALYFLKRHEKSCANQIFNSQIQNYKHEFNFKRVLKKSARLLPISWLFFALAYSIVPYVNKFLEGALANNVILIPFEGWAIAAASIAHITAALALTGGALASGALNNFQAVFALILGSAFGLVTRILRQDAGYYFGLFKMRVAIKILLLNFASIIPFVIISLIFAGVGLLF